MNQDQIRMLNGFNEHPVFGKLNHADREALIAMSSLVRLAAGEALCQEREPVHHAWVLLEGEIKQVKHTMRGQALLIDLILPGELYGAVYYRHQPVYACSAIALKLSVAIAFPLESFWKRLDENPALQRALLEDTCIKLCHAQEMRGLLLEEAPVRMAHLILQLADRFGDCIPETRSTLAELAGITTETAIRLTGAMSASGIIRTARGRIEILSMDRLREAAQGIHTARNEKGTSRLQNPGARGD